jgi:SRSO17 transposase
MAYRKLTSLKPEKGENIYLIIDDSKKRKYGKHMDAVSKMMDSIDKVYINGHLFVAAVILFRGFVIPFAIRLYVKDNLCGTVGVPFKKTTNHAAEIITEFEPPRGVNVTVLFDSFYLCRPVIKACKMKGFHWISTLKSNRNLYKNGRKLKVGKYAYNLFYRKQRNTLSIDEEDKMTLYKFVDAGIMKVSRLGNTRIIFSRKNKNKKIMALATDITNLNATEIIKIYAQRWTIEVFFKESKQLLGLGQYQNRSYRAAVTHLHLVCFAYALLTHLQITQCEKGKKKNQKVVNDSKMSTASMQNELRLQVWGDLVENLKSIQKRRKNVSGNFIINKLEKLLIY